jgi:predicted negative regulator of RcsB-dependent stress response
VRARSLLILTAIVSSLLGAVVAWLVLTVPNDLQAGAMMKIARKDVAAGHNDKARQELSRIIQQYPRTDAAAAATVALATIADSELHTLAASIETLRRISDGQQKQISELTKRIETPPVIAPSQTVTAQALAPAIRKKPAVHKAPRKRRR